MENSSKLEETLAQRFLSEFPIEAAHNLEQQSTENIIALLLTSPFQVAATVLTHLNRTIASDVLVHWPEDSIALILENIPAELITRFLRLLGKENRGRILAKCDGKVAKAIHRLLKYPEDTVGALMDPNVLFASEDTTAKEALRVIRGAHSSVNDYFYVVDTKETLTGVVSIRGLLEASENDKLGDIMKSGSINKIMAQSDRSSIIGHQGWANYHAMPVVDRKNTILGVISYNTLRESEDGMLRRDDTPLVLAIGEMYWTMLSHVAEAVMATVTMETHSRKEAKR